MACTAEGVKRFLSSHMGTYLGGKRKTLGSKTDITLAGIVRDVAHMFVDLFPLGVEKVKDFDAAGGRDMFHAAADDVRSSPEHRATMNGCMDVLNAVGREIKEAGCVPMFVLLSPDVGTCLRVADSVVPECLELPVHPSGARSDPVLWEALRAGLEHVQIKLYMIEHNCDLASAAAAVGALRKANHDKVEAFCDSHGVIRTVRTPNSFFIVS